LRGNAVDTSPSALENLQALATTASSRERAVMQIEREVVDLYRAIVMKDHIGDSYEGTVSAVVSSGVFVALDDPFVDVLVRYEEMGPDHYDVDDSQLAAVGRRSGDRVMLGDRLELEISDVALLRRSVYGSRVVPDKVLQKLRERAPARRGGPGHAPKRGPGHASAQRGPRSGERPKGGARHAGGPRKHR
jgi:ribonuclease R